MDVEAPQQRVHIIAEEDYRFGVGPLHLAIDGIDWSKPLMQDGEHWFEADGVEMAEDGRVVGRRRVLIRGSRLARLRSITGPHRPHTR
ncbi:MAG TPA: hypothetical protein VGB74_10230 [Actinoplanes sp.]|jgi:hypothetical protein